VRAAARATQDQHMLHVIQPAAQEGVAVPAEDSAAKCVARLQVAVGTLGRETGPERTSGDPSNTQFSSSSSLPPVRPQTE
jgi:hypothetical protein